MALLLARPQGPVTKPSTRRILAMVLCGALASILVPSVGLLAATPAPLTRPFPAPVTSRTVTVPARIDSTGSRDVSLALRTFVKTVPDGSTILFRAGGVYRLDRGLFIANRHHLVFDGKGATLKAAGSSTLVASSAFVLDGANSNITVRNFVIDGGNRRTGADLYAPGQEGLQGIAIYGGSRIEIAGNTISNTHGDGIYANEKDTTHSWVDGLWIHDNTLTRIGRTGVTFNAVAHGMVERNRLNDIGMFVFNIEPNTSSQGAIGVTFRKNTVGTYGLTPRYTNWFFASANYNVAPGAVIRGITISGNHVTGGAVSHPNTPAAGGLATWIGRSRVANVKFLNNTTTKPGRGPVLIFDHVDGLTVTGNVQPLVAGSLTRISDSTGVVSSDRDTTGIVAVLAVALLLLGVGRLISRNPHNSAGPTSPGDGAALARKHPGHWKRLARRKRAPDRKPDAGARRSASGTRLGRRHAIAGTRSGRAPLPPD